MIDEKTLEQLFEAGQICVVTSPAGKTWLCFRVDENDDIADVGMSLSAAYLERKENGTKPVISGHRNGT